MRWYVYALNRIAHILALMAFATMMGATWMNKHDDDNRR